MKMLADENLDGRLLRSLVRRLPGADIVRAIDVGLAGVDDPAVLAWAAEANRVVVTHDVMTMIGFALDRIAAGEPMPGLIVVAVTVSIREATDDLALLITCSHPGEWDGQVLYVPL